MYKLAPYISIVSLLISAHLGALVIHKSKLIAIQNATIETQRVSITKALTIIETHTVIDLDFVKSVIDCAHNEYLSDITCQLIHSDGE